jgi:hypothetical protein
MIEFYDFFYVLVIVVFLILQVIFNYHIFLGSWLVLRSF